MKLEINKNKGNIEVNFVIKAWLIKTLITVGITSGISFMFI